jgi:hypothetical protein
VDCNYLLSDDPDIYFLPAGANNPQGFWRRQFGDRPTETQFNFDVAFGLVLPVLCFVFDPGIFHRWLDADAGFFGRGRLFVYCASAVEMATLACWLFAGPRLGAWSRPAGGVMKAGGIFSLLVGLLILPFSVLGIFVGGLGLLGFIPFATAVVYLRNGARALRHGRVRRPVRGAALLSLLFGCWPGASCRRSGGARRARCGWPRPRGRTGWRASTARPPTRNSRRAWRRLT